MNTVEQTLFPLVIFSENNHLLTICLFQQTWYFWERYTVFFVSKTIRYGPENKISENKQL